MTRVPHTPPILALAVLVALSACVSIEGGGLPTGPSSGLPITDVTIEVTLDGPATAVEGQRPTLEWSVSASARQGADTLVPDLGVQAETVNPTGGPGIRIAVFVDQTPGASRVSGTVESPVPVVAGESVTIRVIGVAVFRAPDGETTGIEDSAIAQIRGVAPPPASGARR